VPSFNFCARIADAARRFPDRPAIEKLRADGVETMMYAALIARAGEYAAWLAGTGVAPGDRAAILADNDAQWIAAYLGTLWIGAVAVPLDTAYKAGQVRTIVEHCGARVLFTTPRYLDTARDAVSAIAGGAPQLVLLTGSSRGIPGPAEIGAGATPPPIFVPFETNLQTPSCPSFPAVILYTSGTTADPKGVVLTHANLDAEREAAFAVVHVTEADAVLGVLPLFHALAQMANLLLPLAAGARVVFLETVSSATLLDALQTRGITIFACVPQFFYLIHQRVTSEVARRGAMAARIFRALLAVNRRLRESFGWNPGRRWFARVHQQLGASMRLLITGGSRFDPAIGRDLYALGFTLLNAYGLTETSGGATIVRPTDRFTTSVGQPFPGVEIKIDPGGSGSDEERGRVSLARARPVPERSSSQREPPGSRADGEILIRGPIVMREYFRREDATREAIDADGWLHTGDLGRLDADGRLYITGRLKEIIVLSSGKNLYPEEIEAHYRQSPVIQELCVLGYARPGEPAAERLHAVIVPNEQTLRARGVVNVGDLIRFEIETASASLPAHKRILSYDISLEPLPRTTTGKLRRHEIERRVHERAAEKTAATRALTPPEIDWLHLPDHQDSIDAAAAHLRRSDLRPDANLELDLGLDSMERVELLAALERRAGRRVAPAARATIFTLRQLIEAVSAADRAPEATESTTPAQAAAQSDQAWTDILNDPPDLSVESNLSRSKTLVAVTCLVIVRAGALLARLILGFRVTGRDHLPAAGPFILCPNHQSHLDGFFLTAALPFSIVRSLFFVGAAEYFESPLMARAARALNIVPVDPDSNLVSAMKAGAAGLRLKKVLILFPEGERTIDGDVKKFRKGAAILGSHLQAPLVPVAISGVYPLWPRARGFQWRQLLPGRSGPVTISFGEPIFVEGTDYAATMENLRNEVTRTLAKST